MSLWRAFSLSMQAFDVATILFYRAPKASELVYCIATCCVSGFKVVNGNLSQSELSEDFLSPLCPTYSAEHMRHQCDSRWARDRSLAATVNLLMQG